MSIIRNLFVLGTLTALPLMSQAQTTAGSTPGSFRVTESGAAEYRIPIRMPPGIAGMEPKLALVYNSQAGNGLLGVGWNLEGLSAISRCPMTMAQDGVRGAVNYDANDRYCLDGQRLIAVTGSYGAAGTEYRTERESFSKVISYGVAGNGPAWFKVWTKSGQIMEYGNTGDSRIEAQGKPTVRVWALNKVSDTKGNYFGVTYAEDNVNGDYFPVRIDYTGNTGTNTSPGASVQLGYMVRTDVVAMYEAGSVIRPGNRLASVKTYVGNLLMKEYRLEYDNNGAGGRSRLVSVTECSADNACLSAVAAQWSLGERGAAFDVTGWGYPGEDFGTDLTYWQTIEGDFNGDGKTDFARVGPTFLYVLLGNGDGTYAVGAWAYPGQDFGQNLAYWQTITGDFNGDGKTDFARIGPTSAYTFLSNGDSTFAVIGWAYPGQNFGTDLTYWQTITGDFDGDGRTDFARVGPTAVYVLFSTGDGTFAVSGWGYPGQDFGQNLSYWQTITGDFNGDGRTDFARVGPTVIYVLLSNGDGTFAVNAWGYPGQDFGTDLTYWQTITGDFNGDGLTDFARVGPTAVYVFFSNGNSTFTVSGWGYPGQDFGQNLNYWQTITGDFNGDGRTDFARVGPTAIYVLTSNGTGTFALTAWGYPGQDFGTDLTYWQTRAGDFNGDGRGDFVRIGPTASYTFAFSGPSPDLVTTISNGSDLVSRQVYLPLTNGSVYTKDNGAAYPVVDLQTATQVVQSNDVSDGIGATRTTSYRYGGLKAEVGSARGLLGFRWQEATQPSTGMKARTEFAQTWPYVGMPSLVKTTQSSGAVLSLVSNTLACKDADSGAACIPVVPGKRYFPFVSRSDQSGSDLNGAVLPTVTTTTQYGDNFGNATSVVVSTNDGYSKTTTNVYNNDTTNWLLGRLKSSTVQSTTP